MREGQRNGAAGRPHFGPISLEHEVEDFQRQVIERSETRPVLVDFWAPWCGPCKALAPVLETVAQKHAAHLDFVKVNVDMHPDIAQRLGIRGIPDVKLFVDGTVRAEFSGALQLSIVERWLEEALPGPQATELKRVQQLVDQGQEAEALRSLEDLAAVQDPDPETLRTLARLKLWTDPTSVEPLLSAIPPASSELTEISALRRLADFLQIVDAQQQLPDNPVKAAYVEAARALRKRQYKAAFDKLLEVIARDRKYDEDGARRTAVALFHYLGDQHPLTREYRARLSDILY